MSYQYLLDILKNSIMASVIAAAIITQVLKIIIYSIKEKRFAINKIISTGGMPSSHSAVVTALTIGVFFREGVSAIAIVTFVLSLIIIRDATGLRSQSGLHALVLNKLIRDLKLGKKIGVKHLNEFLGHTPTQAFVGVIFGVIIALVVHKIWLTCGCLL